MEMPIEGTTLYEKWTERIAHMLAQNGAWLTPSPKINKSLKAHGVAKRPSNH